MKKNIAIVTSIIGAIQICESAVITDVDVTFFEITPTVTSPAIDGWNLILGSPDYPSHQTSNVADSGDVYASFVWTFSDPVTINGLQLALNLNGTGYGSWINLSGVSGPGTSPKFFAFDSSGENVSISPIGGASNVTTFMVVNQRITNGRDMQTNSVGDEWSVKWLLSTSDIGTPDSILEASHTIVAIPEVSSGIAVAGLIFCTALMRRKR